MLGIREISPISEIWTARSKVSMLAGGLFTNDKKSGVKNRNEFFELIKKETCLYVTGFLLRLF